MLVVCIEAIRTLWCVYTAEKQQASGVFTPQQQEEMRGQSSSAVSDSVNLLEQQIKDRQ